MKTFGTFCLGIFLAASGAGAQADYELFAPTCPVKDTFPGYKFKTINALGVAVLANASEDIGTFLDIGCDPNFSETSLTYIETKCKNPIFDQLGIPCAREVTVEGYTPLILAVISGNVDSVKKLAEIPQIDLDAELSTSENALWLATSSGNQEKTRALADAGAKLDVRGGEYLSTPLGNAVLQEDIDLVRYLLRKGADVNIRSKTNSSPANYAVGKGNLEILKLLKSAGADLDGLEGEDDASLLIIAAATDKQDILEYLLAQKVDVNKEDAKGRTAMSFASFAGYLEIVKSLVRSGANLDTLYGPDEFSALAAAVLKGHTDIALFLIQSGAEVNNKDVRGFTAAHNAAQEGNLVVLKALAEAGADLDVKGGDYQTTPLGLAALKGHLEVVKFLAAKGVDLGATDKDGKTALELAREFGRDDVVEFLEEK